MATRRLVNIATELNVATTTVVEYLSNNGFEIENKPTAKVSDDMYAALLKQFSGSLAVKEQADKLSLGRHAKEGEKVVKPAETPAPKKAPVEPAPVKAEPTNGTPAEQPVAPPPPPPKEEKAPESTEAPATAESAPEQPEAPAKGEDMMRAETPQLKGLKILGKIDATRLEKPKAKKPETEGEKASTATRDDSDDKTRRRRKRRKITQADVQRGDDRSKGKKGVKKDDSREVSQKEIEEQIRMTMARLTGGGKNKRQKIRRESRDKKAEKLELLEQDGINKAIELT